MYQKLNKPTIKIAPPIARELNAEGSIDWIEEVDSFGNIKPTDNIKEKLRVYRSIRSASEAEYSIG